MISHNFPNMFVIKEITDAFIISYDSIKKWGFRTIQVLNDVQNYIPSYLEKNQKLAKAIFIIANAIFFILINLLANSLEERIEKCGKKMDEGEKKFNFVLINGVTIAGSILIFNIIFAKLTNRPINKLILISIITGTIGLRYI